MRDKANLAERLFAASRAECDLEDVLAELAIPYETTAWDDYDRSLELQGVEPEQRLTAEQVSGLLALGFVKIYVNHTDKWETHYSAGSGDGWRVSYPHKRVDGDESILVEGAAPEGWPRDWTETGYVRAVPVSVTP